MFGLALVNLKLMCCYTLNHELDRGQKNGRFHSKPKASLHSEDLPFLPFTGGPWGFSSLLAARSRSTLVRQWGRETLKQWRTSSHRSDHKHTTYPESVCFNFEWYFVELCALWSLCCGAKLRPWSLFKREIKK